MRMASMNAMYQNVFIIIDKDLTNALISERSTTDNLNRNTLESGLK